MSELTQIFRVPSTVAGLTQQGMTWEAIEADRLARGLDKPKRAKRATVKVVTFEGDRRLPSNVAVHVEQPRKLAGYTVGQAKAARKATMKACPCRLCALALNPPATYADAERFGLATIGAESAGVWEVSVTSIAVLDQHEEDRAIDILVGRGMTTAEAFKVLKEGRK